MISLMLNLVALKTCIEINYARLASLGLQSEMSNTQSMKVLEAKFPPTQQVEWTKYLNGLPVDRQVNVFPEFLKWLDIEGNVQCIQWVPLFGPRSEFAPFLKIGTILVRF